MLMSRWELFCASTAFWGDVADVDTAGGCSLSLLPQFPHLENNDWLFWVMQ